jgi:hypothetical protein
MIFTHVIGFVVKKGGNEDNINPYKIQATLPIGIL